MNTGNMYVHQWLMTTRPHLVAEHIQYNDSKPFQPLQRKCAVNYLDAIESMHGKLTNIVRYWLLYKNGEDTVVPSFGLGSYLAVNSIIGLPTLRQ